MVINIKRAELARIIMIRRAIKQRALSLIGEISEIWPGKIFFSYLNSFNIQFLEVEITVYGCLVLLPCQAY
jgi:hypothetical protein